MKFAYSLPKKGGFMLLLIMSIIISCGTIKDNYKPTSENLLASFLPVVEYKPEPKKPQIIDTPKRRKSDLFDENFFKRANDAFNTIEVLKINVEWQKRYMRVVDSARARKVGKDSMYTVMLAMRDTMNAANKRANVYFAKAQKVDRLEKQIKTTNIFIDYQFYIALIILCASVVGSNWVYYNRLKKLSA